MIASTAARIICDSHKGNGEQYGRAGCWIADDAEFTAATESPFPHANQPQ
jgi:hypothetical protein